MRVNRLSLIDLVGVGLLGVAAAALPTAGADWAFHQGWGVPGRAAVVDVYTARGGPVVHADITTGTTVHRDVELDGYRQRLHVGEQVETVYVSTLTATRGYAPGEEDFGFVVGGWVASGLGVAYVVVRGSQALGVLRRGSWVRRGTGSAGTPARHRRPRR